jgi:asparagine synthetase B (glutamine-hydrolysing)
MCGINGIFAYHSAAGAIDRDELIRTRDHMAARGPDAAALWTSGDARCGLGHRRLSIIDLSPAGAQPMASADGNLIVTFNGEIYDCPVYNYMLKQGAKIGVYEVPASAMHGLGTPEDLDAYLARRPASAKGARS